MFVVPKERLIKLMILLRNDINLYGMNLWDFCTLNQRILVKYNSKYLQSQILQYMG